MTTRTASPVHKLRTDLGLSPAAFARLLGASERSIRQWEDGDEPGEAHSRLLKQLERIYLAAKKVMKPQSIGKWFESPVEGLGGLKPREVIERGEHDRVWRLLFAVESGGHR
jgi:DNA-binding XRE family transcriptional regulator